MVDWGSLTPQIIVALIGVVGSILVVVLTNMAIETNRPNLDIILPYDALLGGEKQGHVTMDIVNLFGRTSATNIMIRIEVSGNDIINNSIWSTENSNVVLNNSKLLLVNVPRLAAGEGTIVNIDMALNRKSATNCKVYVSFDQGSKYTDSNKIFVDTIRFYLIKIFSTAILLIVGFLVYSIFTIISVLYGEMIRPRKEKAIKFVYKLRKDILEIRRNLREDEKNRHRIEPKGEWDYYPDEYKEQLFKTEQYIRIDDFYSRIATRNSKIMEADLPKEKITKMNEYIISLADNILKHIEVPQLSTLDNIMYWLSKKFNWAQEGFGAELSGFDEIPRNNSPATGTAEFKIRSHKKMTCTIFLYDIRGVMGAGLFRGKRGEKGQIVARIFKVTGTPEIANWKHIDELERDSLEGELKGKGIPNLIYLMKKDEVYVTVFTHEYPNGEIRGQIFNKLI